MKSNTIKQPFSPYFRSIQNEDDASSRHLDFRKKSTIMVSLLIAAAIIFCMAMIIVGALHADRSFSDALSSNRTLDMKAQKYLSTLRSGCPGQPIIPWYLIIAGSITIIFLVIRILILRLCTNQEVTACDLTYLVIYDIIMLIITVIWLAVGTHYVADLYLRKNYSIHNPNQDTCDFGIYWYSFAIIILGWITVCLCLIWIINKYGRALFNCLTCNKYGY